MELVLFESVLFGELRPWAYAHHGKTQTQSSSAFPTSTLGSLLEEYPRLQNELADGGWEPEEEAVAVAPYIKVKMDEPFDRCSLWHQKVITLESRRLLDSVVQRIKLLEDVVDQRYEVNTAIRDAIGLLKDCSKMINKHDDKLTQYVLELMSRHIMMLILDLSHRYADLGAIEQYDEAALYTAILNRAAPEQSPFLRTPAYRRFQLSSLLRGDSLEKGYRRLRRLILEDLQTRENEDKQAWSDILFHLENAVFLQSMKAPFIDEMPEKLLDEEYCREWVMGIRLDFMKEQDIQSAAALFNDFSKAERRYQDSLGMIELDHKEFMYRQSEAVQLLTAIKQIREQAFGNLNVVSSGKRAEDGGGESKRSDFVQSFRERFVTLDEFEEVLPASSRSVKRYLEESDIRVLAISSNIKFLYREDVETYFEERTMED